MVGIAGDGQEHFLNEGGDWSGFVFGTACSVGELAHGIQAAFEGEALEVDVVGEGGLLHDATDDFQAGGFCWQAPAENLPLAGPSGGLIFFDSRRR